MTTNDPQLTDRVLKELVRGTNLDDIVLAVIENTNMDWSQAEAFVTEIQREHDSHITRRQSPVLVAIALVTYFGGLAIIGYELYYLFSVFDLIQKTGVSPFDMFGLASSLAEYAMVFLELTPLGLAMILGSLIGMRKVWESFLFLQKD